MQQKRYHIIIDISGVAKEIINDKDKIEQFITDLPPVIDMHILAGPLVADGIPENPGVSAVLIIDFSHISIHTFSEFNEALVDIFSCKPFDKDAAVNYVVKHMNVSVEQARIKEVYWG